MTVEAKYNFAYKNQQYFGGDRFEVTEEDMKFISNDVFAIGEKKSKPKREVVDEEVVEETVEEVKEDKGPKSEKNKSIKAIKGK